MSFKDPEMLWLLLLLPVAVWLYAFAARRRTVALRMFYEGRESPETAYAERIVRSRRWRSAFVVAAGAFLISAMAGPLIGAQLREAHEESLDLVIALDVSSSMDVQDVPPSRLERAKLAITQLVEERNGDRIGLVVFSGDAFLQCPLTNDRSAFRLFLDAAGPNLVSTPGTDFANALFTSRNAFVQDGEPGDNRARAILVVSDGEDHEGGLDDASASLESDGVVMLAAGIGTDAGGPIPLRNGSRNAGFKRDENGQQIISKYEEGVLRSIAGSGNVVRLGESGAVNVLSDRLDQLDRAVLATTEFEAEANRFQWPLGFALLLLLIERLIWLRGVRLKMETA